MLDKAIATSFTWPSTLELLQNMTYHRVKVGLPSISVLLPLTREVPNAGNTVYMWSDMYGYLEVLITRVELRAEFGVSPTVEVRGRALSMSNSGQCDYKLMLALSRLPKMSPKAKMVALRIKGELPT